MKKWAFISDFDGTISEQDFYWLVINKYYPEGKELFKQWKNGEWQDIDFLSHIFKSIHRNEAQIRDDIRSLPLDDYALPFAQRLLNEGIDFYILSAGTDYYIKQIMVENGMDDVKIFSNKGYFKDHNVHLELDSGHRHYSARYGINKAAVLQEIKENYDFVFYYGDSEPDSHPAKLADTTFAKDSLIGILEAENVPHIPVDNFKDVETYLIKHNWLTEQK